MVKKYSAKTDVSINVVLPSKSYKHITFTPRTGGGSVHYEGDEELQEAIEKHRDFGRLFVLESIPEQISENEAAVDTNEENNAQEKVTVNVTDADSAKDYLSEKFGISRSKMKSVKQIKDVAESYGVEFVGI